ncbi:MAG TPA: PEP/pyruvate-binding domain-containing protein [Fluviicola sp.]|nr:PEP/pyruvate-binding domain-containing protein [Fluviicola sp.]
MKLRLFLLLFVCCSFAAGWSQRSVHSISDKKQFLQLAGQPLSSKYGNIASIKVIVDTKTKKLYYINSVNFRYHYDFVTRQLFYPHDLYVFNEENYSASPKRDYLLANINCNEASGMYYLDLSVFDLMPANRIIELFDAVKAGSYFGDKLVFLLNTERLIALQPELDKRIKTAKPSDIYAAINYQAISEGKVKGRLRFEPHLDSLKTPLLATDIVFTTVTPEYLPTVRGLMLTAFQTPLSHLVILAKNRHIPIGVYTRLYNDSTLRSFENQWIELTILPDTFYVKKADVSLATQPVKTVHLKKDTETTSLITATDLNPKLAHTVGNKAANFGLLYHVSQTGNYKVPEAGFAIPFYWYEEHAKRSGADELIRKLIARPPSDPDSLQVQLKAIRKCFAKAKIDTALLHQLENRLDASGFRTFRFRSSTNAEDAAGFSGAGLYASKTVDLDDCNRTISEALQDVWASLWSYEAYIERNYFGIANEDVAMGVLVHRSFPDEEANGVAITKNIYRESYAGFIVNVQKGDVSVVTPPAGVICDQLVLYPPNELSAFKRTTEVITTSNLNEGKLVLSDSELELLQTELERIKRYYWKHAYTPKLNEEYDTFGLDLEFKFSAKTRELYIKQVRIYND